MLKRIKISGLGPHLDFRAELDPRGATTVSGPSEVGKSFLIEAVLFGLYGRSAWGRFRPEAIHDDHVRAAVELTLDSGRTVRRTITRSKAQTRAIVLANNESRYASEAAFQQALGDLGSDPEAIQQVMVPLAWQALASGNARPLRDLLSRILPGGDPATEVERLADEAGIELQEGEASLPEKKVGDQRRSARKSRDESAGRLSLSRERLEALEGAGIAAVEVAPADDAEVALVEAWEAYEAVLGHRQQREAAARAQADWDRRQAEIGPEPTAEIDAGAAARATQAQQALQAAWQTGQQVQAQLQQQQVQAQMFAGGGDTCPMCQRPGWTQGAAMAQQVQGQVEALQAQWTQANEQVQAAQAAVAATTEAAQAAQAAQAAKQAWRQGVAALGTRPEVPELPDDAPEEPERPSDEALARVAAWRHAELAAQGLTEKRQHDLDEARQAVVRETERHAVESTEADRLETLLDLVRRAPTLVAEAQARALGDLGSVSLEFADNPAVRVLIDGREWWLASRGRQVVADATLRAALRRALQMPYLPLFVDNVQDVGGQPLPEVDGPSIWLQTTDGKGIFVRRRALKSETEGE